MKVFDNEQEAKVGMTSEYRGTAYLLQDKEKGTHTLMIWDFSPLKVLDFTSVEEAEEYAWKKRIT